MTADDDILLNQRAPKRRKTLSGNRSLGKAAGRLGKSAGPQAGRLGKSAGRLGKAVGRLGKAAGPQAGRLGGGPVGLEVKASPRRQSLETRRCL